MWRHRRLVAYIGGFLAAWLAADALPWWPAVESQPDTGAAQASEPPPANPGDVGAGEDKPDELLDEEDDSPIFKTDKEWRKLLTRKQYRVTRQKETERAFTGKYLRSKKHGTYCCVCCGAKLFASDAKYKSGTGWPSFWTPIREKSLRAAPDYSDGQERMEVLCARCDAHLGHVFWDGPPPTGLRFCINSTSLKLDEQKVAKPSE